MRKEHKSSPPIAEGLIPSKSTPQLTELQLRQRNVGVNPAVPDLRPSKGQASLLPGNHSQECSHRASPHQPCRSGVGLPALWVEASAHSGNPEVIQTGDLVSNPYPAARESVQSIKENSASWRNTVMSPRNDHRYSRNYQPFSSTGRALTYALGPSVTSIENTDFATVSLPVLLYSLGCSEIREGILNRGLFPQKRWNDHGNVQKVTLRDAGLDEQVACLFFSKIKLEQAIQSCIQLGLIVRGVLADDSLAYSLSDQARHQISESFEYERLSLLGLVFTAHLYPRDQSLEPS